MSPHMYRWRGRWLVTISPETPTEQLTAACWWALDRKGTV